MQLLLTRLTELFGLNGLVSLYGLDELDRLDGLNGLDGLDEVDGLNSEQPGQAVQAVRRRGCTPYGLYAVRAGQAGYARRVQPARQCSLGKSLKMGSLTHRVNL